MLLGEVKNYVLENVPMKRVVKIFSLEKWRSTVGLSIVVLNLDDGRNFSESPFTVRHEL